MNAPDGSKAFGEVASGKAAYKKIAVIGDGAFGTALAAAFSEKVPNVVLRGRNTERAEALQQSRRHPSLTDTIIPDNVHVTSNMADALHEADAVLLVVKSDGMSSVIHDMSETGLIKAGTPVISAAKGLEKETDALFTDVIAQNLPSAIPMALSGPSFAGELSSHVPTVVSLAAKPEHSVKLDEVVEALRGSNGLSLMPSSDPVGTQVAGVMKNVIAIACGVYEGAKGPHYNALEFIKLGGMAECGRLVEAMGGERDTLNGPAGTGDLALTCTNGSRNYRFGVALGRGDDTGTDLAEGAINARRLQEIAGKHGVQTPFIEAVKGFVSDPGDPASFLDRIFEIDHESIRRAQQRHMVQTRQAMPGGVATGAS